MKNILNYINESILSSTNSGKYAIKDSIIAFVQEHIKSTFIQKELENIEVQFENDLPYAILHMKSKKTVDIVLDNPDKKELDILQRIAGIYCECKDKYWGVSLEFRDSNSLVLDFSKSVKGTFCNNSCYSITFYRCKDISIKTLPTDFGKIKGYGDNISIYDGSTIKSLPNDMGHADIFIGVWAFTNKKIDDANLSALEGSTFGTLSIAESYIALSNMYPQIMIKCRNGQYKLMQKYNERFAQIVSLKINIEKIMCTWAGDSYEYIEYDKRIDAYIFNKK